VVVVGEGLAETRLSTPKRLRLINAETLHAYSPSISPPSREYEKEMPVVGAINMPDALRARLGEDQRDASLVQWLAAGSPPVFFGMGSMPVEDPLAMLKMIAQIVKALNVRAIVGAGWSKFTGADEFGPNLKIVGAVDHAWLFPQCKAAVHHGGAGTVHAVVGAGLPSLVASVFADQPYWGTQLTRLGAGQHVPFARLNRRSLESGLAAVLDPTCVERAAELGQRVRAEPDAASIIADRVEAMVN
jgi:sterol 3beta-glucosyltransferase